MGPGALTQENPVLGFESPGDYVTNLNFHHLPDGTSAAYSADWASAKKADDERMLADWARINELKERQQAEAKRFGYQFLITSSIG